MIHELKCFPVYFQAVWDGNKPFEVRKNDRGYKVGDRLLLKEYEPNGHTGRSIKVKVTYVSPYVQSGYVVLGLDMAGRLMIGEAEHEQDRRTAEQFNVWVVPLGELAVQSDADLITHAPEDITHLLDLVEKLQAVVEEAEDWSCSNCGMILGYGPDDDEDQPCECCKKLYERIVDARRAEREHKD